MSSSSIYHVCFKRYSIELVSQTIYFTSKHQGFSFKVITLESKALSHLCNSSMRCRRDNSEIFSARWYVPFDGLCAFQTCHLDLRGKKKVTRSKIRGRKGCFCTLMFFSNRNCPMLWALKAVELLWWSSHDLSCRTYCLLWRTTQGICRRNS